MTGAEIRQEELRRLFPFVLFAALLVTLRAVIMGFSAGTESESQSLSDDAIIKMFVFLQPRFAAPGCVTIDESLARRRGAPRYQRKA